MECAKVMVHVSATADGKAKVVKLKRVTDRCTQEWEGVGNWRLQQQQMQMPTRLPWQRL